MPTSGETHLGDEEVLISLRDAARILNLHYATVYRYLRLGRLPATLSGGRWMVDPRDLALVAAGPPPESAPRRGRPQAAIYRRRLLERLLAADEPGAWGIVESALVAGPTPTWVLLEVLAPALREIGDGWATGRFTVGDEHRATAVAVRLAARLGPLFARRGRPRGRVVLAGAPGDPHSLPSALLADVLRGERFAVVDLGADTPPDDLAAVAADSGPLLAVGISVSIGDDLPRTVAGAVSGAVSGAAPGAGPGAVPGAVSDAVSGVASGVRKAVEAVRSAVPGLPVLVGGPAIGDEAVALAYGADGWAPDGLAVARYLEGLLPRTRSPKASGQR